MGKGIHYDNCLPEWSGKLSIDNGTVLTGAAMLERDGKTRLSGDTMTRQSQRYSSGIGADNSRHPATFAGLRCCGRFTPWTLTAVAIWLVAMHSPTHGQAIQNAESSRLPVFESRVGTTYRLGKRPYPAGTREQWIQAGRVLGSARIDTAHRQTASSGFADNRAYLPPIADQGSQGSCVHWAGSYYAKTATMKRRDPSLNIQLAANQGSPRFTYNLVNAGEDNGGYGHEPFEIFMRYGVASLHQLAYQENDWQSLPASADFVEGLHRRSTNYVWLWDWQPNASQIEELKLFLDAGGIAVCAVNADESFDAWSAGDAPWIGPATSADDLNHMVTVCGYAPGWYLAANSWSSAWGSNGFIQVDADYFETRIGDVFYSLEGPYATATHYAVIEIDHPYRSDLQAMQLLINGTLVHTFSPLPKNLPLNGGGFPADPRNDLKLAVDLSGAAWQAGANTATLRVGDRASGDTGQITLFRIVADGDAFTSAETPTAIPDNSGFGSVDVLVNPGDTAVHHTLIYTAGTGGYLQGNTHQTVDHGDDGTPVTAVPHDGFIFTDWSDGLTGAIRTDTGVTGDITVQARFTESVSPPETVSGTNLYESFDNTNRPAGWIIRVAGDGHASWRFDDPGTRGNLSGGEGHFAIADSDAAGIGDMDTTLQSPELNLTTLSRVWLEFKTDYRHLDVSEANVDISVNGTNGPWQTVWRRITDERGPHTATINVSAIAAGQPQVVIRFRYWNANWDWWWQIDDVIVRGEEHDSDDDNLPDAWELHYFGDLTTADATSDFSGNGVPDRDALVAGTDPCDPTDLLTLASDVVDDGVGMTVSWPSVAGRTYRLYSATDPREGFTLLSDDLAATPPRNVYTDSRFPTNQPTFYRVTVDR